MALEFWKRASPKWKRFYALGFCFLLLIGLTVAGTLTPLTPEEASDLSKQLEQTQEDVQDMSVLEGTVFIFQNNFIITLLMLIPFAGPFIGAFITYNTGVVIAAQTINTTQETHPTMVVLMLFIFPFAWMEFIVYALAFSESLWLSWCIVKRKGKEELLNALIAILICMVILLAAAAIEMVIIKWAMSL